MSSTQPQLSPAAVGDTLVDDDDFFAAAARGELPEARPGCARPEDHSGVGAATLPRVAASADAADRRHRPARRRRPPLVAKHTDASTAARSQSRYHFFGGIASTYVGG